MGSHRPNGVLGGWTPLWRSSFGLPLEALRGSCGKVCCDPLVPDVFVLHVTRGKTQGFARICVDNREKNHKLVFILQVKLRFVKRKFPPKNFTRGRGDFSQTKIAGGESVYHPAASPPTGWNQKNKNEIRRCESTRYK